MSNSINGLFIILVLGLMVCAPGRLRGEAGNTGKVPVMLVRGDTIADRPVVRQSGERNQGPAKEKQKTQGREQEGQNIGRDTKSRDPLIREFVPSEEIAAEQAVDFPADI
ncbi:MAG: hypothetical protein JRJ51_07510 [Deltaproteobacteria bacterium]|nr:hypothetical protein [Deltaproteobacteria bacterium]MBW1942665.1 hypothetical protein [Deltaproteobacteria bacterium]